MHVFVLSLFKRAGNLSNNEQETRREQSVSEKDTSAHRDASSGALLEQVSPARTPLLKGAAHGNPDVSDLYMTTQLCADKIQRPRRLVAYVAVPPRPMKSAGARSEERADSDFDGDRLFLVGRHGSDQNSGADEDEEEPLTFRMFFASNHEMFYSYIVQPLPSQTALEATTRQQLERKTDGLVAHTKHLRRAHWTPT